MTKETYSYVKKKCDQHNTGLAECAGGRISLGQRLMEPGQLGIAQIFPATCAVEKVGDVEGCRHPRARADAPLWRIMLRAVWP